MHIVKQLLQGIDRTAARWRRLRDGESDFAKEFDGVGADEIANMEKELIEHGGVKVEEVQKLCDVHASIFKGSVAEIHAEKDKTKEGGHPTWVLKEENRAIERLFADRIDVHATSAKDGNLAAFGSLAEDLKDLWQIDAHYGKKENLWFPIMERYGITAPPKVMWGVDDEIRDMIKALRRISTHCLREEGPRRMRSESSSRIFETTKEKVIEMISRRRTS